LNIKDGKATYVARFVKTSKLQQEEYYGAAKFVKVSLLMPNNMWTRNHLLANNVPLALDVILEYCSLVMQMRFARVWLCAIVYLGHVT
jgi:carotenoid cleavage dioxygenase-like enzyme